MGFFISGHLPAHAVWWIPRSRADRSHAGAGAPHREGHRVAGRAEDKHAVCECALYGSRKNVSLRRGKGGISGLVQWVARDACRWPRRPSSAMGESIVRKERGASIYVGLWMPRDFTGMNLIRWQWNPEIGAIEKLVFSPDGRHIAWIAPPNQGRREFIHSGLGHRRISRHLEKHTNTVLVTHLSLLATASLRILGTSANLIAWHDNDTLLTVTEMSRRMPVLRRIRII